MILFYACSMIKDESKNNLIFFGHFMNNIGFLWRERPNSVL